MGGLAKYVFGMGRFGHANDLVLARALLSKIPPMMLMIRMHPQDLKVIERWNRSVWPWVGGWVGAKTIE